MPKLWWIALTGFAIAVGGQGVNAQVPSQQPAPPVSSDAPIMMAPPLPSPPTVAPYGSLLPAPYSYCCSAGSSYGPPLARPGAAKSLVPIAIRVENAVNGNRRSPGSWTG